MQVNNVEQMLQIQLMNQMLQQMQQSTGNSGTFQVALESIMQAMQKNNTDLSKLGLGDLGSLSTDFNNIGNNIESSTGTSGSISSGSGSIEEAVNTASKKYNIDKSLIEAVIKQESSFNPNAKSSAGAMGLMQLMPGTAKEMGVDSPYSIEENVDGGTHYLKNLLDMYAGSKELALSAYNAGPGTLLARGVDSKEEINKLPSETKNYVSKIMKYYSK